MKKGLKITVIGSGSTYTPELINGFITRKERLEVDSFYLMDIDREKNEIVSGLARRMLDANGMDTRLVVTESLEEAIEGADYVLGQIRVGRLAARVTDEKIPLKYGLLGQETTGAGGFMKALRTIPELLRITEAMERLAPDAWLINFSNPSGIAAEAILNHTKVKMMGLCNGPINMVMDLKKRLPADIKSFDYDFVGLNHLCWITSAYADGKDVLRDIIRSDTQVLKNVPNAKYSEELLNAIPAYAVAYLNYYYFRDYTVKLCMEAEKTRGEICMEVEKELLEMYKDPLLKEKPAALDKRGGSLYSEAAVSLIDAIVNDKNEVHVVDVLNNGAYSFMDNNDVIETKCLINKRGATPLVLKNFDNQYIIGLMKAVKAYEKLTVKAAIEGDYNSALAALMVHPLIGDYTRAKGVLDEMLQVNKKYLPRFFK